MALRSRDDRRVAGSQTLAIARHLLETGQSTALAQHLATIPEHDADPELTLIRAESSIYSGDTHRTVALVNDLLASGRLPDPELKARALLARASALRLRGFSDQAIEDASEAMTLLTPGRGNPRTLVQAHKQIGIPLAMRGEFSSAIAHFEAALDLCSRLADLNLQAEIHVSLGITFSRLGRLAEAAAHYQNAALAYDKQGRRAELATLHNNIGRLHHDLGEYETAILSYEKSLQIARQFRYIRTEAMALVNIGDSKREMGDALAALPVYRQALECATVAQEPRVSCCANVGIGVAHRDAGDFEKARFHLDQAIYEANRLQLGWELATARLEAGMLALATGRLSDARDLLQECVAGFEKLGSTREVVRASLYLAETHRRSVREVDLNGVLKKIAPMVVDLTLDRHLIRDAKANYAILEYAVTMEGTRPLERLQSLVSSAKRDRTVPAPQVHKRDSLPRVEVRSLGGCAVTIADRAIDDRSWGSQKARELLVLLLCERDGKTTEELLDKLWPDAPTPSRSAVHNNVYRIRQTIHPGCVVLENGRYRIGARAEIWLDLDEFRARSASAASEHFNSEKRASQLIDAGELYRGEFLAGFYSDWILDVRRDAEAQHIANLHALAAIQQRTGNLAGALATLDRVLAIDPINANAHERAVAIEQARGDHAEADRRLKVYHARFNEQPDRAR